MLRLMIATISVMIGAGFAGGREVYTFFAAHGYEAPWLALAATALLVTASARTVVHATSTGDLHRYLFGRWEQWSRLGMGLMALLTLSAVLAALGQISHIYLHTPAAAVSLMTAGLAAATVQLRDRSRERIQLLLLISVITVVLIASAIGLFHAKVRIVPKLPAPLHALGALGYAAYNIALAAAGISERTRRGRRATAQVAGAMLGGLIVGILLTLEATALAHHAPLVARAALPLLAMTKVLHPPSGVAVAVVVFAAGLSAAIAYVGNTARMMGGPFAAAAAAWILSLVGVRFIVDSGYPVMAGAATIWLVLLFWSRPRRAA